MNQREYHEVNDLLSQLRASKVVDLVKAHYQKYDNSAPGAVLEGNIASVEKLLAEHVAGKRQSDYVKVKKFERSIPAHLGYARVGR